MPVFHYRLELRPSYFDPTLTAFISIDTIDKRNDEVRILGYSAINFFINRKTK